MCLEAEDMNVLIVRLSPFRDVVKSTPHQFLYGECARVLDDASIDFAFLPTENERKRKPGLVGMRTKRKALDYDLILISNSYAVELVNLPYMLKIAGIPYKGSERKAKRILPLLVMGGSNALASQGILFDEEDALVDALYVGEGEGNTTRLVEALKDVPPEKRREVLRSLQGKIEGLKVFGVPGMVRKAILDDTGKEMLSSAKQYLFDSSEATTARLQISYGCPFFCTFCHEGWERKPYREIPKEELLAAARKIKKETGADTLEITTYNFNTYSDIVPLFLELNKLFFRVNFMSQRADILAANPSLLDFEVASDKRQYTIGVEGISQRMRSYFNKNLDGNTLRTVLSLLLSRPIREIKLFFILSGLETEKDIADFHRFLEMLGKLRVEKNRGVRLLFSFGLLVRMPFTPLRYERLLLSEGEWTPVVDKVKTEVESAGYEFRLTYPYDEYFLSQTLVMTSSFIAPVLVEMAGKDMVYDTSLPPGAWTFFSSRVSLPPDLLAEKAEDWHFAYSFVDCRTPDNVLYQRFLSAKEGKESETCMGGTCKGCGSCTSGEKAFLQEHSITMPSMRNITDIETLVKEKAKAKPILVLVRLEKEYIRPESRYAAVMRTLVSSIPDGEGLFMSVQGGLFSIGAFGDDLYEVYPFSGAKRDGMKRTLSKAGYAIYDTLPDCKVFVTGKGMDRKNVEAAAKAVLDDMHLPYVLARNGEDSYFNLPPKSVKKHMVDSCKVRENVLLLQGTMKMRLASLKGSGMPVEIKIMARGQNDES